MVMLITVKFLVMPEKEASCLLPMIIVDLTYSVATAGFFPLDLGFFGVVWVSGYFCQ